MSSTEVKRNGFSIVAGALPIYRPFVMVYTPNGTLAMNHYGDPYCTDAQEMIALGQKTVDFLCDFERLEPHHRELVARQSVEYIARSFNISLDVAYGWKVVATMGMGNVHHALFADEDTKMMMGVMEVVDFNAYDLKFIAANDLSYNPALGTGQLQVRDIHYVTLKQRTAWEFCELLDKKFIASKKGFNQWLEYAKQHGWIK